MPKTTHENPKPRLLDRLVRSGDTITFRYHTPSGAILVTRKVLKVIVHEPEYLVESCSPHQIVIPHSDLVAPNAPAQRPPAKDL